MSYALLFVVQFCFLAFSDGVTEWINKDGWIQAVDRSTLTMRHPGDFLGWLRLQRQIDQLETMESDLVDKEKLVGTVGDVKKLIKHDVCRTVEFENIHEDIDFYEGFVYDLSALGIDLRQYLIKGANEFDIKYPDRQVGSIRLIPHCDAAIPLDYSPLTYDHLPSLQDRQSLRFEDIDSPRFFEMIKDDLIHDGEPNTQVDDVDEEDEAKDPVEIRIVEDPYPVSDTEAFDTWSMRIAKTLAVRPDDWVAHIAASYTWRIRRNVRRAIDCARRAIHFAGPLPSIDDELFDIEAYRNAGRFALAGVLHGTRQATDATHILYSAAMTSPRFSNNLAMLVQLNATVPTLSAARDTKPDISSRHFELSSHFGSFDSIFNRYKIVMNAPKCINAVYRNPIINDGIVFRALGNTLVASSRFDAALYVYEQSLLAETRFTEVLQTRRVRIACYLEVLDALRAQNAKLDDALRDLDDVDAFTTRYFDAQKEIDAAVIDDADREDQQAFYEHVLEIESTRGCPMNIGWSAFGAAGSSRSASEPEYLTDAEVQSNELNSYDIEADSFERPFSDEIEISSDEIDVPPERPARNRRSSSSPSPGPESAGKFSTTAAEQPACDIDTMLNIALEFDLPFVPVDPGGAIAQRAIYTMTAERLLAQASRLRERERAGTLLRCRDLPITYGSFEMDWLMKRYRSLADGVSMKMRARAVEYDLFDFFQSQLPFARDLHIDDVANVLVIMHQQRLVPDWYVLELAAFYHHLKADYASSIECALLALAHAETSRPLVLSNLATLLLRLNASGSAKLALEYELFEDETRKSGILGMPGAAHLHYLFGVALFRTHSYVLARKHFEAAIRSRSEANGYTNIQAALPSIERAVQHINCIQARNVISSRSNCSAAASLQIDFMRPPAVFLWLPELTVFTRRRYLEFLRQTTLKPTRSLFVAFDRSLADQTYQRIPLDERPFASYFQSNIENNRKLTGVGPRCYFESAEEKQKTYVDLLNITVADLSSFQERYNRESDLEALLQWTVDVEIYSDEKRQAPAGRAQIVQFLESWLTVHEDPAVVDEQLGFAAQLLAAVYWRIEGELEKALDCALVAARHLEQLVVSASNASDSEDAPADTSNSTWRFASEVFVSLNGYDFELRKLRALPRVLLAGVMTKVQRVATAERLLEEAINLFPESPLVHFGRANLHAMRRDWWSATHVYLDTIARSATPFTAALDRLRYLLCVMS